MAQDPNALKYPEAWKDQPEDLAKLPPPPGIDQSAWNTKIATGKYYANVKVYADGRRVVEWYQRDAGGGPGQPDPIDATSQDVLPAVKDEYDKGAASPTTRLINGVPSQVVGTDANGQSIWAPVQTPNGPATAAATPAGTGTGSDPRVPAGSVPRIEGTPVPGQAGQFDNSSPIRAWHAPDGRVIYEPLTPAEVQQWQRDKNGGKTDAEQTTAQTAQQPATKRVPVPDRPGLTEVTTVTPATATTPAATETHYEDASGNRVAAPGPKPTYITAQDGTVYEMAPGQPPKAIIQGAKPGQIVNVGNGKLVRVGQEGPATVVYDDPASAADIKPDGKGGWVRVDPRGGSVTQIQVKDEKPPASGPPRPNMIVGHTVEALNKYADDLDAQVAAGTITTAQRTEYWNQAKEMATLATNEATLAQHQAESNLNASVQLANNRATNANSGFNAALSAVMGLNDKLPKGSHAGAEAFISLLGLQLMNAQAAGGGDAGIKWPKPPPSGPSGPTPPNAIGAGAIGAAPAPGAAPPAPAAPVTPSPTAGEPGGPPLAPGPVLGDPPAPAPEATAPAAPAAPSAPTGSPDDLVTITSNTGGTLQVPRRMVGEGPGQYGSAPERGGYRITDDPQAQAPAGATPDFAVLAPYQQQAAPQPAPAAPTPDVGTPTALLYSQAAATPFWQMDADTVARYRAAGIPESVIKSGTPGVAA